MVEGDAYQVLVSAKFIEHNATCGRQTFFSAANATEAVSALPSSITRHARLLELRTIINTHKNIRISGCRRYFRSVVTTVEMVSTFGCFVFPTSTKHQ